MGLFGDDFYSTKVSRRAEPEQKGKLQIIRPGGRGRGRDRWQNPRKSRSGFSSTVKVAVISSVISSIVTVTLFSFIMQPASLPLANAAGNGGDGTQTAQAADPYDRIIQAAAKVRPSVVSIVNHKTGSSLSMEDSALGSGVIFKKEDGKAYIMTNHHVVEGASDLEIVTVDGETHKAKLVGKDRVSDIAVLSVQDDKGIGPAAELGDSSKLQRGQTVLAIGNPLGLGGTLTSGIVSYTDRILPVSINQDGVYDWEQNVIQTDAAINEGNSGGALADLNGKLVGINTMKISDTGVEGLGFAIPMNEVMKTVDSLLLNGKVSRPYLGVYTVDLSNPYAPLDDEQRKDLKLPSHVDSGVVVLEASGPASDAGMKLNDVITEFDGQKITSTLDLRKYLYDKKKIGDTIEITFYRDGNAEKVSVKLTDKPE
ncbi:trypsin-like peptidase domain-containing protein [Paenibacillus marchantiae]|uniref:S1C family serine protease n=1 Tax=Paenibacillus marchantiae TaxID=3026433 RepID=UPI00237A1B66|nr:trypsin-like peptidase domain-containing protein [Paenibacillus marchantiae]WDQ33660.1 trypsin-like peptidase domain-containing protein [Paenibacillus marchantiae]